MNKLHYSKADYDTYWCAANTNATSPPNSGVMFGGIYTDMSDNPLTGAQRCPNRFYPLPLGGHAHVCISDDYEQGYKNSIKFAGFYSCSAGNPLAIRRSAGIHRSKRHTVSKHVSVVENFMAQKTANNEFYGPKECPQG